MVVTLHAGVPQATFTTQLHAPSRHCLHAKLPFRTPCSSLRRWVPLKHMDANGGLLILSLVYSFFLCRILTRRAATVDAPSAPPSAAPTTSGHSTPEDLRAHLVKKGRKHGWYFRCLARQQPRLDMHGRLPCVTTKAHSTIMMLYEMPHAQMVMSLLYLSPLYRVAAGVAGRHPGEAGKGGVHNNSGSR